VGWRCQTRHDQEDCIKITDSDLDNNVQPKLADLNEPLVVSNVSHLLGCRGGRFLIIFTVEFRMA